MGISDRKGREGQDREGWKPKGNALSWSEGPSEAIHSAIQAVTESGGAILFTKTRDGNTLQVKVFHGTDGCSEYCQHSEDIPKLLDWIARTFG